jgi:hypothetical protein
MLFVLVMVGVGFAAHTVKRRLGPSVRHEKVVCCPSGNTDPECGKARRLYDAGTTTTPSAAP